MRVIFEVKQLDCCEVVETAWHGGIKLLCITCVLELSQLPVSDGRLWVSRDADERVRFIVKLTNRAIAKTFPLGLLQRTDATIKARTDITWHGARPCGAHWALVTAIARAPRTCVIVLEETLVAKL